MFDLLSTFISVCVCLSFIALIDLALNVARDNLKGE